VKQAWLERPEGGTVLGYRLLAGFTRIFGRTASRAVLYPITFYFFLRRGPERRASRAYLERVTGAKASLWQVAKHIHCFAAVTLDRAFLLSESFKRFDIRTFGLEELRKAWGRQHGVLVFGSHLGSFDAPARRQDPGGHRPRAESGALTHPEQLQPATRAVDHQRAPGRHDDGARDQGSAG
jgi:predicted LPLAT superfamily acyltransferase